MMAQAGAVRIWVYNRRPQQVLSPQTCGASKDFTPTNQPHQKVDDEVTITMADEYGEPRFLLYTHFDSRVMKPLH